MSKFITKNTFITSYFYFLKKIDEYSTSKFITKNTFITSYFYFLFFF